MIKHTSVYDKNRELNLSEFDSGKIVLESKPRILRVALTTRCNLRCIMCRFVGLDYEFTLPGEVIEQVVELFPYLELVDWQGGEVFLLDNFKELLVRAAKHTQLRQTIQTNGLLLNEELAEILARSRVDLQVSVDGATKDVYEHVRKGARFETLMEKLSIMAATEKAAGGKFERKLSVCVMKSNNRFIGQFVDFALKYGFKRLALSFMSKDAAPGEDIFFSGDEEALAFLRIEIPLMAARCLKNDIVFECDFLSFLSAVDHNPDLVPGGAERAENLIARCRLPWKMMMVTALGKGDVFPECMCHCPIGNVCEQNLLDIWNSEAMQRYRSAHVNKNASEICNPDCLSGAVFVHHFIP